MLAHIIILLALSVLSTLAMPPHPERWDALDPGERSRIADVFDAGARRGLDAPGISVLDRIGRPRRDDPAEETIRIPVILIDFADNQADANGHPPVFYARKFFSQDEIDPGSVRDWVDENSLGQVQLIGDVVGWYRMPQNYNYYVAGIYGLGNYPRNAQRMAEDAIRAADRDLDYSRYDHNDDGLVDAVVVLHAGPGAELNPNNRNIIWSHTWQVENVGDLDGIRFRNYVTVPEDGNIGVFGHELGHAIFGLPDLYDTRNRSTGIGTWSMMAYGSWGDQGRRPVHFDAWCKTRLGWANVVEIAFDQERVLPEVYGENTIYRLWNPNDQGPQYFLAEYRRRVVFDASLVAEGLLVYHIDEQMQNNDNPWWPGNQGQLHNLVALEQADNRWDLERNANYGDAGDPYPGSADNRHFHINSSPGSRDYAGNPTGVAIRDIAIGEQGVSALWAVGVEAPDLERQTIWLTENWNLASLRVRPESNDVRAMTRPLVEAGLLVMVKDEAGRFYHPPSGFNNIPSWETGKGYMMRLIRSAEWVVEGEPIQAQTEIPLRAGWRFMAYYPDYQLTAPVAFSSLGDALTIAKDVRGRFYVPRLNYNSIPLLRAGQGYQVNLSRDAALVYPEP